MEKDKMIEEMAKDIRVALEFGTYENLPIHIKDRVLTGVRFYKTAEILLEKYQPKLPEGSEVLTNEEAERFRGQTVNIAKVKAQACKETAEKFADIVYKTLTDKQVWNAKHNWWLQNGECFELKDLLKQILKKQFGVDVENE